MSGTADGAVWPHVLDEALKAPKKILSMETALWGGLHQHMTVRKAAGSPERCGGVWTWVCSFAHLCEQVGHAVTQAPLFLV